MKTYPHKLDDVRRAIQSRHGVELTETLLTLDSINQVGWDPLDILANSAHTYIEI